MVWVVLAAILVLGVLIMSQLDDIKQAQADTKDALGVIATDLAEIVTDLDALIALVGQQPPPDLSDVLTAAQDIRDAAKAQADAATAAAGKFTPAP